MKRFTLFYLLVALGVSQLFAQVKRSDDFHQKYKLSEVVVFSRHNIRAPLAEPGSFISTITPHTWHDFGVGRSELTMKGGILETTNGQFFHQWVVSEGLFSENAIPTDEELVVVANSKQRTISTARHFISAFMPMKTIDVQHVGKVGDMDPLFTIYLGTDMTEEEWAQLNRETAERYTPESLRQLSESLKPNFDLLEEILDVKNSPAYLDGSFKGFNDYDSQIIYKVGAEPEMTGSLNQACQAVDALVLQCYEEPDLAKVAFGKDLTREQWLMLYKIIHTRDHVRFCSPWLNHRVSHNQRQFIAEALQTPGRRFTYMCGHDVNILNILLSLHTKQYDTTESIELGTPIGSKIVFEKWTDANGNEFIGVNHVYQTFDQLRNNTLLNLNVTPNIIPLQFEGLTPNEDGLYTIDDMVKRLTDKDQPAALNAPQSSTSCSSPATYNLAGLPVGEEYQGIVIQNGKVKKHKN